MMCLAFQDLQAKLEKKLDEKLDPIDRRRTSFNTNQPGYPVLDQRRSANDFPFQKMLT